MSTLKGRNAHKRGTFGGVAACPHCSAPVRLWLQVRRTQCVVDLVVASHLLPPHVPLEVAAERDADAVFRIGTIVGAACEPPLDITVVDEGGVSTPDVFDDIDALAAPVVVPGERGFDDDETPFPKT